MKINKYCLTFLLISSIVFLLQVSCTKKNIDSFENQLIFQVGEAKYYGENLTNKFEQFSEQYKGAKIPEDSIEQFITDEIDKLYVVADAYNSGLDDDFYFIKSVEAYKKFEMGKAKGPLWDHSVEPLLTVSEATIQEFYKKGNRVFYASHFRFEDSLSAANLLTAIKEGDLEPSFVKKQAGKQSSRSEEVVLQYPFKEFAKYSESVDQLQVNQLSEIMRLGNGYSILYINKIETIKQQPLEDLDEKIREYLKNKRMFEVADSMQDRVLRKAKPEVSDEIFKKSLAKYIEHSKPNVREIDSLFSILSDSIIVQYKGYHGESVQTTVRDVNEYYFYIPIRRAIQDSIGLLNFIFGYIIDDYFWQEGCELGLADTDRFTIKLNREKNELLKYYYHERYFKPKIQITEDMLQACYEENSELFTSKTSGVFTKISFTDRNKFEYYTQMLNNMDIGSLISYIEKNDPEFMQHVSKEFTIRYDEIPQKDFEKLYHLSEGEYAILYYANKEMDLFYKNAPDLVVIRSLEDVKGIVRAMCEDNETSKLQSQLISDVLKPKYELKVLYTTKELIKLLKNK